MKFKITEIKTESVKVEFDDGSWANVPITKGQDQESIYNQIKTFAHLLVPFDQISDVPVTVADTWIDVSTAAPDVDYKAAREQHYPSIGDQMDALHWAREGDDTNLKAVDVAIKEVKTKISKGSTYKASEVSGLLS